MPRVMLGVEPRFTRARRPAEHAPPRRIGVPWAGHADRCRGRPARFVGHVGHRFGDRWRHAPDRVDGAALSLRRARPAALGRRRRWRRSTVSRRVVVVANQELSTIRHASGLVADLQRRCGTRARVGRSSAASTGVGHPPAGHREGRQGADQARRCRATTGWPARPEHGATPDARQPQPARAAFRELSRDLAGLAAPPAGVRWQQSVRPFERPPFLAEAISDDDNALERGSKALAATFQADMRASRVPGPQGAGAPGPAEPAAPRSTLADPPRGCRAGDSRPDHGDARRRERRRRRSASSSATRWSSRCWTRSSASARSSRCCATRRSRTSWSTASTRSTSSGRAGSRRPPLVFRDDAHVMQIIERIVSSVGRRIDESSPMVDARLPTARASTPSSRRSRSTGRCCRSGGSAPTGSARDDLVGRDSLTAADAGVPAGGRRPAG